MKMLWQKEWLDTPAIASECPDHHVLVDVRISIPLIRLGNVSGRKTRRPLQKALVFAVTDGPRSTLRKIRAKRGEPAFTGDYWVTLVLGREAGCQRATVGLACKAPAFAQQLVIHKILTRTVPEDYELNMLESAAGYASETIGDVVHLCRQNYLHSGMSPPRELADFFARAVSYEAAHSPARAELSAISMPGTDADGGNRRLRLGMQRSHGRCSAALLGSGDYARTEIIPALKRAGVGLESVADREPQVAALVAQRFGFAVATSDASEAITDLPKPGLVVVATAHDSHASLACAGAAAGHRVFVEKPPAVTAGDVARLTEAMAINPGQIDIGFNRRYHPLLRKVRQRLAEEQGPLSLVCTIKEVALEDDHWYFWPNQGTRITGNLCHWIDLAVYLLGPTVLPESVSLSPAVKSQDGEQRIDEERALSVTFDDGSLLVIVATGRGDDIRGVQEQIELRRGSMTVRLDDLWKGIIRQNGMDHRFRKVVRTKAHSIMYRDALGRMLRGEPASYPRRDVAVVSAIQIVASELVRTGAGQADLPDWLGGLV